MKKQDIDLIEWGFEMLLKAVPKMVVDIFKLNQLGLLISELKKEHEK